MTLRHLRRVLRDRAVTLVRRARGRFGRDAVSEAEYGHRLELTYANDDPFKMASPKEQFRFAETNRLLSDGLMAPATKVGSILEIGCGEGHQSEHLAKLCDRLTGIDVAAAAVARARSRAALARALATGHIELIVGDPREQPWAHDRWRFDIVTACEVIYYFNDIPKMLELMSRLGRGCLVTYHRPAAYLVEPPLKAMPIAGRANFTFADVEWRAAWWRSP